MRKFQVAYTSTCLSGLGKVKCCTIWAAFREGLAPGPPSIGTPQNYEIIAIITKKISIIVTL